MRATKRLTIIAIFIFCAVLELFVAFLYQGPAVVSDTGVAGSSDPSGRPIFSGERALAIHRRIFPDFPHPAGSAENAKVRADLIALLQEHGWTVERQTPSSDQATGDEHTDGNNKDQGNIVAFRSELKALPGKPLVLASHFDSCNNGPGAGDAGACVAAVVEAARLLTLNPESLRRPVWLLCTDGEEQGLLGAKSFVAVHPLSKEKPIVLNFDARGTTGPVVMFETHPGNYQAVSRLANKLIRPRLTGSLFTSVYQSLPNGTDFTEFRKAGWQGFNFALIDGAHRYHRPDDRLENVDPRSIQHLGSTALSVGTAIAESTDDFSDQGSDAIFVDILGWFVVTVPVAWNLPVRFGLLFIAVQIYGRPLIRSRVFWPIFRVWLTMALILPLMMGLGWLVSRSLIGSVLLPKPFVAHGHWISLAMWGLSLGVCCWLMHSLLRRIELLIVWRSFWLAHAATCMVVSMLLPAFSYLLAVPAMLAIVATFAIRNLLLRTAVVACLSAVILIPLHHLLAIALGPANGMLLFPAFGLMAMPLLPAFGFSSDRSPRGI